MRKIYFVVAAVVVGMIVGVVCFTVFGSMAQQPLQPLKPLKRADVAVFEGIQVRAETDKEIYKIGEPVEIRVFAKNLLNEPIFPFLYVETIIWDSNGQMVLRVIDCMNYVIDARIMPMEEYEVPAFDLWYQLDSNLKQVPPGIYTIQISCDGPPVELRIMIVED